MAVRSSMVYSLNRSEERCGEMVGCASATRALFREIRQLAPERCAVLILGETGTGKELAARALHELGHAGTPWVALNCAAISESLATSELFGHERGSFTGAVGCHKGAFERAAGGTLFLDEIGELPLPLQAQLLRVLETREFLRVGGDRILRSDFRLVAATHRDLHTEVAAGRFREDLFFRLSVAMLRIPPLRERREDIRLLVQFLLRREGESAPRLADQAWAALLKHTWSGNIRELANVLVRAKLKAAGGIIQVEHLGLSGPSLRPAPELYTAKEERACLREPAANWGMIRVAGRTLEEIERDAIQFTLQAVGGSQAKAARQLGIPRSTLHDRLRRLGLNQAEERQA